MDAKSLEVLDGQVWGDPPADATTLWEQIHHLRRVELCWARRRSRAGRRCGLAGSILSIMVLTQACGGAASTIAPTAALPSMAATAAPPATAAPAATSTGTPAPPADAAPATLQGSWSTVLGSGETVILTIRPTSYKIERGGPGALGHVSVVGDEITFSRHDTCMEEGTYRWTIEGEILTLTQVGSEDACPHRKVLLGYEYERRDT